MPFLYKAFNLLVESEIEILHLPQIFQSTQKADITVKLGSVPLSENERADGLNYFFSKEGALTLQFLGVGRFLIENGSSVTIQPFIASEDSLGTLSTFVMGSVMGGLLHQRGYLLLHGNAVVCDDKAYIFAGESGAGKSTLAAAFSQAGCQVLSDDVSAIIFDEQDQPWVIPAYPAMKLWQDAADYFKINTEGCHPVVSRENKFHVGYSDIFCSEKRPLVGIYFLEKKAEKFNLKPLGPIAKIQSALLHTYVKRYSDIMGFSDRHLKQTAKLVKNCQMYTVDYPHHRDSKEALMKLISPELQIKKQPIKNLKTAKTEGIL